MTPGPLAYVVGIAIFGGAALYSWGSPDYLITMVWAGLATLVVGGVISAMTMIRTCPICTTRNLQRHPPADAQN